MFPEKRYCGDVEVGFGIGDADEDGGSYSTEEEDLRDRRIGEA